jgi:hypothetical protein
MNSMICRISSRSSQTPWAVQALMMMAATQKYYREGAKRRSFAKLKSTLVFFFA